MAAGDILQMHRSIGPRRSVASGIRGCDDGRIGIARARLPVTTAATTATATSAAASSSTAPPLPPPPPEFDGRRAVVVAALNRPGGRPGRDTKRKRRRRSNGRRTTRQNIAALLDNPNRYDIVRGFGIDRRCRGHIFFGRGADFVVYSWIALICIVMVAAHFAVRALPTSPAGSFSDMRHIRSETAGKREVRFSSSLAPARRSLLSWIAISAIAIFA